MEVNISREQKIERASVGLLGLGLLAVGMMWFLSTLRYDYPLLTFNLLGSGLLIVVGLSLEKVFYEPMSLKQCFKQLLWVPVSLMIILGVAYLLTASGFLITLVIILWYAYLVETILVYVVPNMAESVRRRKKK